VCLIGTKNTGKTACAKTGEKSADGSEVWSHAGESAAHQQDPLKKYVYSMEKETVLPITHRQGLRR